MKKYETIDGKWWLFEDDKPVRLLSDTEAADVIWGEAERKSYELTGQELEKLQEYEEPSNRSLDYEKNIEHEAQGKLLGWLNEPCIEHIYCNGKEIKPIFGRVWKRYDCEACRESLLEDFGVKS
ncbi:MAG: hypothetical protein MUP81_06340 [Dehalococcoidia bacterium]|nr:hypothetical protein [Dehalococcoidia bacterium]